jgi:hypothetical protein
VYRIAALLPLLVAGTAAFITEEPRDPSKATALEAVTSQLSSLKKAASNPSVWKPALFFFLWQATPSSGSAFLYFMTDDLGFSAEFLGRVKLVCSVAGLGGIALYNRFLKDVSAKKLLLWTSLAGFPLGMANLVLVYHLNRAVGISDSLFVYGDDVIATVLGSIAFIPTLVLAAKLCPVGVESTLFALLMSVFNFSGLVSGETGALLTKALGVTGTDFTNLGPLVAICNVAGLVPLLFIDKLLDPAAAAADEEESVGGVGVEAVLVAAEEDEKQRDADK